MYLRLCFMFVFASLGMWSRATRAQDEPAIRPLAPGVLSTIPSASEEGETFTGPISLVEVVTGLPDLEWTPHYDPKSNTLLEKAKNVTLRRAIWDLEFSFKPLRMLEVDVPQPSGKMQRKLIWYLVYRVSNRGYALNPTETTDEFGHPTYSIAKVNFPTRRFFPHFVLETRETQRTADEAQNGMPKAYQDRIIPAAQKAIQMREDPGVKLHNSVEMSRVQIPLSDERTERGVWGVAMWEDIDPRIDFFSIYIKGLTNAFKFVDPPGAYQIGAPPGSGRVFSHKALQLNFWRPGDTSLEHEEEIRFGIPVDPDPVLQNYILSQYGLNERLDYLWVYR